MKKYYLLSILFFAFGTSFSQNLTSGLKVHYLLDNNGLDATFFGNHLNVDPSVTYSSINPFDFVAEFNGNNRAIQIGNFNNSSYSQTTISLWFRADLLNNGQMDQIMMQGAFSDFSVGLKNNTGQVLAFFDGSSSNAVLSPNNYIDSTWHHLVAQNNGSRTDLYLDGVLVNTQNELLSTGNGSGKIYLGATNLNTRSFTGALNDVRIYDRILTQAEIDSLSNPWVCDSNNIALQQNLTAQFKFDNDILDNSGNNEDLTSSSTLNFQTINQADQAFDFNGSTRLNSISNFDNSGYTSISISTWVKTTTTGTQTIIQGAFMGFGILIPANEPNKIAAFFDSSSSNSVNSNTTITDGIWHHVVAQNNGSTTSLYVDGVFQKSQIDPLFTGNGGSNNKLYFGSSNLNLNPYTGSINNTRIYNRTLSTCEIDSLYASEKPALITTSIVESSNENRKIFTYPNPTTGIIHFNADNSFVNAKLSITNILGQQIFNSTVENSGINTLNLEGKNGIYFLEIIKPNGQRSLSKIIKR